jgi:hypothetical protein
MILTPEELAELTRRTRKDAQVRVLRFMGIEHRVRPDGSVAVLRSHVEAVLGGGRYTEMSKQHEPDWSAVP